MSGDWQPGEIPGVWQRDLVFHGDERGAFAEIWRRTWTDDLPTVAPGVTMVQGNLSRSQARVLRGLHMHQRQADLWIVVSGQALIGLVDVRPALEGSGPARATTLEAGPGTSVYLPEGVAHGFYAREPLTLLYLVTNEYDGSDEHGFAWDDPDAGIDWPDAAPILSGRDAAARSLDDLVRTLRDGQQTSGR